MKRVTSLSLMMVLLLLTPLSFARGDDKDKDKDRDSPRGMSVPVAGTFTDAAGGVGRFAGTLTITHFARVNDAINAVGSIAGTLTDSQGNVVATGLQSVSLPITLSSAAGPTVGTTQTVKPATITKASFSPAAMQVTCQILRLSIGAIDLNLLGLTVHLNPVLLIINAVPGAGNLLGNLLCAIVNLLNGGGPLAQIITLLNQLLALLGG